MKMIVNDAVYGEQEIRDPLAVGIIKTKEMQRLKGVNQYGVWKYITPWMTTTRFEHSLGVYFLLRIFKASREEQIAGLVHDVGHAAFSHVYDFVKGRAEEQDCNDRDKESIIINSEIKKLLDKEGIGTDLILNPINFPLLEKNLPDLCSDRIDYILRDSLCYGITDKKEVLDFLNSLRVENNRIFFTDINNARKLTLIFMKMDDEYYRSAVQNAIYSLSGEAMRIALDKKIISNEDFFSTDNFLMDKMMKSNENEIIRRIKLINQKIKVEEDPKNYDFFIKSRCRCIDPLVMVEGKIRRISEIDHEVNQKIRLFMQEHSKGRYIRIAGLKNA